MTARTQSIPTRNGRAATGHGRPTGRNSRARPGPVEQRLPSDVVEAIRASVETTSEITPGFVADVDRRYAIAERFGVTRRRLGNFLRKLRNDTTAARPAHRLTPASADPSSHAGKPAGPRSRSMRDHRQRQGYIAAILSETFGSTARCSPDLWERRAYLMIVALVYERLATNEEELTTEELAALSKVLAESRRADARSRQAGGAGTASAAEGETRGALPERFSEVVRKVYGTSFQEPATAD